MTNISIRFIESFFKRDNFKVHSTHFIYGNLNYHEMNATEIFFL